MFLTIDGMPEASGMAPIVSARPSEPVRLRRGSRGVHQLARALGQPLEGFQRRIVAALHGPERETVVMLPRGNAKTALGSRAAFSHLLTEPTASVALGSGSREQSQIAYDFMARDSEHPALAGEVEARLHAMRARRGGQLRVVSGRGHRVHGRTDSVFLLDELWSQDGTVLEAAETGLVKRPDARLWILSTAPLSADTPLGRLRERALALPNARRNGAIVEASGDGLRWLEWSLDPELHDPNDVAWIARHVNPASWITEAALREQHARLDPRSWLTFHCNVSHASSATWLPVGVWQACRQDYAVAPGEPLIVAVDAGGGDAEHRSVTAIVATTLDLRVAFVKTMDGAASVLDVFPTIDKLAETHPIHEVVYDRWGMASEALRNEDRYRLVQFQMNGQRQVQASEALIQAAIAGRLQHPGDPDLDAHSSHATTETTPLGARIVRAHREPIDAITCLSMCAVRAQAPRKRFRVFTPA